MFSATAEACLSGSLFELQHNFVIIVGEYLIKLKKKLYNFNIAPFCGLKKYYSLKKYQILISINH